MVLTQNEKSPDTSVRCTQRKLPVPVWCVRCAPTLGWTNSIPDWYRFQQIYLEVLVWRQRSDVKQSSVSANENQLFSFSINWIICYVDSFVTNCVWTEFCVNNLYTDIICVILYVQLHTDERHKPTNQRRCKSEKTDDLIIMPTYSV